MLDRLDRVIKGTLERTNSSCTHSFRKQDNEVFTHYVEHVLPLRFFIESFYQLTNSPWPIHSHLLNSI